MRTIIFLIILVISSPKVMAQNSFQRQILFNESWRFCPGGNQGAEKASFDDSAWRQIDLPHDWSIEDLPGTKSPFSRDAVGQTTTGFTSGGIGWYRKSFTIPEGQKGNRVVIQFDGVYMNAEVWLNGQVVGKHAYGYTTFQFDITDKIRFGQQNIVAVKVQNLGENSRWYSGSGIYRHVWLNILHPVHIAQWGTSITTPEITSNVASVSVKTSIQNYSEKNTALKVKTTIRNSQNQTVAVVESPALVSAVALFDLEQNSRIENPELWSVEKPSLYKATTELYLDDQLIDQTTTSFGVRTISFDAKNGFQLNGKTIKLKGGCIHHDNGPLGAKAYDRAEFRKIELLKASGYNAVRSAHNPPSTALLDACDSLGMLVIDESFDMWKTGKNQFDYHLYFDENWKADIESMVLRDRNHPSVIMWSIGNEIPNKNKPEVVEVAKMLADYVRALDPTRPVSSALNELNPDKDPFFATLDIAGYNYAVGGDHNKESLYALDHSRIPNRIMYCSESYPLLAFGSWMEVLDKPYLIGDFVWTAFDYIGEASIGWLGYWPNGGFYPWNLAYCGDIDICGWKRPQSYYRNILWENNALSIFIKSPAPSFALNPEKQEWSKWEWHDVLADWNWTGYEEKPLEVNIYSSCEEVELFLNGKSLGRKPTNRSNQFTAVWNVAYQPGVLKAVGYNGNKQVKVAELKTADEPVEIRLSVDRNKIQGNGQDLSYVTVEITDAKGNKHPKADNLVNFEIEGPGEIIAVGNANPVSLESYQMPQRKAWQGKCMVIVKSGKQQGTIQLKAKSDNLKPEVTKIEVQ